MIYLVDTNILLRLVNPSDSLYAAARTAVQTLQGQGHELRIGSQNAAEFWNVVTRPVDRNGLGLSPPRADRLLSFFEKIFVPLPDLPLVYGEWRRLVVEHGVSGVQVHDARLVALMSVHGISRILTFNGRDFHRFLEDGIEAVEPSTLNSAE